MKRLLFLILAFCLICSACSAFVPSQYVRVSEHSTSGEIAQNADVLSARDFAGLKDAIRSFVKGGIEHGVIRVQSYNGGDVEEDLSTAAYQIAREDPYGAYMVDYMTHSCSLIVSYYEIGIDITFRQGIAFPDELRHVSSAANAQALIRKTMDRYGSRLVLYTGFNLPLDYVAEAQSYFDQNPGRLMAMPEVRCTSYPENSTPCIVEMTFTYPYDEQTLRDMAQAVDDTLHAASVYVRYRDTELEKATLLFTYLLERFSYVVRETSTPVYSHLCDGITSSKSAAQSWQLLCDEIGLNCVTVSGLYQGSAHWWNILSLDGMYYHVDTFRDLLESGELRLLSDADMTDYYWDTAQYPACIRPEPDTPPDGDDAPAAEQPGELPFDPEEGSPSEEEPAPEEPGEPEPLPEPPAG